MIGVVGLGYVGLPLACLLSKNFDVLGLDKDQDKIRDIRMGIDPSGELTKEQIPSNLTLSSNPEDLNTCSLIIVCVPTPVSSNNQPNLEPLLNAARVVGKHMKPNTTVVFESTVYPGVTEDLCAKAIMEAGGLNRSDFKLGYSPERVNPGDKKNTTSTIVKLVSGEDEETLQTLISLYGHVSPVYACPSIKVAEATKLFENVQRDINIAYVNEFMKLCHSDGIEMTDVLEAAATKWNALKFHPGMVGGDCIYTDPYYALQWREKSYSANAPSVILNARKINQEIPLYFAEKIREKIKPNATILFLGLTFKKDVRDCRNSGALKLKNMLAKDFNQLIAYDPLAPKSDHQNPLWEEIPQVDTVLIAVDHTIFKSLSWQEKLKDGGICIKLKDLI